MHGIPLLDCPWEVGRGGYCLPTDRSRPPNYSRAHKENPFIKEHARVSELQTPPLSLSAAFTLLDFKGFQLHSAVSISYPGLRHAANTQQQDKAGFEKPIPRQVLAGLRQAQTDLNLRYMERISTLKDDSETRRSELDEAYSLIKQRIEAITLRIYRAAGIPKPELAHKVADAGKARVAKLNYQELHQEERRGLEEKLRDHQTLEEQRLEAVGLEEWRITTDGVFLDRDEQEELWEDLRLGDVEPEEGERFENGDDEGMRQALDSEMVDSEMEEQRFASIERSLGTASA
jgi:hypothetical protein